MNVALWVLQVIVAVAAAASGTMKIVTPRVEIAKKMLWAQSWSDRNVKLLGLAEVLGAIGLIVPWLTGIAPLLTPVAALCLFVLMMGAVKIHLDLKETLAPALVLGVLCFVVFIGRLGMGV
jgi:hypothetical protein